jgi:hypothetical protein
MNERTETLFDNLARLLKLQPEPRVHCSRSDNVDPILLSPITETVDPTFINPRKLKLEPILWKLTTLKLSPSLRVVPFRHESEEPTLAKFNTDIDSPKVKLLMTDNFPSCAVYDLMDKVLPKTE